MNLPATILDVQRWLNQSGVRVDEDGVAGPQTWGALYSYFFTRSKAEAMTPPVPPASVPTGEVSARSAKVIGTLWPSVRPYAEALIHAAAQQGIAIEVISGLRTYAEQEALYGQGRTAPGSIVTRAHAGYSNHNFGIAFDVGVFLDGKYADELYQKKKLSGAQLEKMYAAVGAIGKGLGLEWGGDWVSIQDQPHFQLRPVWAKGITEAAMLAELRRRKGNHLDLYA